MRRHSFSNQELNAVLPQAHINAQLQGEALCERQYLETVNQLIQAPTGRLIQSILIRYSDQLLSWRTVAERLGLSERTLQRRLAAEDRGFQQLNDQIKKQLAERLLSNSRVGIQTIAQNLGYAETASFHALSVAGRASAWPLAASRD